ncbi:MAG: FAD-binding oxidoreductase [Rhodospirillales bacterium]|nr:FAD-binding oxidoreductase [Rhodospirillales bacterium]MBO6788751.1 FAD-binding oxidoreductase [Rhodospirillales bacterium]
MTAPTAFTGTNGVSADVCVIGGGLHGCAAALHLAMRGKRVVVIEPHYPGRFASGVNAGGVRRLGRDPAEIPLAEASLEMWNNIASLVDDDCDFHACGQLKIAESEDDMAKLEARAGLVRDLGYDHERTIGREKLREIVPDVHPRAVGGLWCEGDGAADPMRTTRAFFEKAVATGVAFRLGERVTGLRRLGGQWRVETGKGAVTADAVLNCAGAWGDVIAGMMGDPVPLEAHALTMMVTERVRTFLTPVCGLASRKLSFKQTSAGTLLIGGAHLGYADRDSGVAEPDPLKMAISAATVSDAFPLVRNVRVARSWAGLEGVTPDRIPVIGPSHAADNAFHAFGFSAHGFQLGPVVGRLMAELIVDGKTNLPIAPFGVSRFAGQIRSIA